MNCLDYRRGLLSGAPESAAMRQHRLQCAQCLAFHAGHESIEAKLREALEVPVPAAFADRALAHVFAADRGAEPRSRARRRWLTAAAAMGGALVATPLLWRTHTDPLALACIQWVILEEAKSIMMGAMPPEEARRVLAETLPIERVERLGQVRHIAPCPFNDGTAYHVVLSRGTDKITLLVMPEGGATRRAQASHEGLHAAVVRAGRGGVGIVGPNPKVVADTIALLDAST